MVITAREHIPPYCSGVESRTDSVSSVEELLALPWVARFRMMSPQTFYQFSLSDHRRLMAEYDTGKEFWVVAYLSSDEPIDLPEFKKQ